jgi:hypothetical protein
MNLSFRPVVMFEQSWPFPLDHLKHIKWVVEAEQIGSHSFEVERSLDSPFEIENDRNYMEFHLTKKDVSFQYDDYPCRIIFRAVLDSPHTSPIEIEEVFWGVVKTIWSKGLQ